MLSISIAMCILSILTFVYHNQKKDNNHRQDKIEKILNTEEGKEEKVVKLVEEKSVEIQSQQMKYWLYSSFRDLSCELRILYSTIVVKNLWIDEPFHTKFYQVLLLLSKNNFMIRNPKSIDLVINMRDENDIVQKSISYEVFSVNEILCSTFQYTMDSIVSFHKSDARNIVFAVVLMICKKSQYFNYEELPLTLIQELLKDYHELENIRYILELIEAEDRRLDFVVKAYNMAIKRAATYPYNNSVSPVPLQINQKLPKKVLQNM